MGQEKDFSVLEMLYDAYSESTNMSNDQIKKDFDDLYEAMNGKTLRECDQVIYPVCALCREHERNGFIHGVKVGLLLRHELSMDLLQ